MRMNIKTQIKDISKRCKDKFNNMIENTLYKYDCYLEYNKLHNFYKDKSIPSTLERDKVVAPAYSYKRKRLSKAETKAFKALWVKTGLVTIDESDGPSPTRKLNPGPS